MSIRDLIDLERIDFLDITLPQRWARRLSTRLAKWEHRYTGLFGRGGDFTDVAGYAARPTVVGGLEIAIVDGEILVSPGQMLLYPSIFGAPGSFAPRPASYTFQDPVPGVGPARPEGDDDATVLYDNAYFKPVPFTFGAALAVAEWWVVYAQCSTATTETDTARDVFNQVTGAWDAATQAKVKKQLIGFAIARGPSSAGFPAIPGGAIPLGAIYVRAAATDLSNACVFDLRSLRHASREPNEIGGCWSVYDFVGSKAWTGHVWAHHRGEAMEARAMGTGVLITDLCSPGATWDPTASPTAPKIAWLYLARAANGLVPRLKQRGEQELTTDAETAHNFYQAGVLVLSPVRPRLGLGPSKNETAGRWDMQSSATIALPSYYNGSDSPPIAYDYSSQAAAVGDAICVGMVVYDGISGGKPTVRAMSVTADGWARGPGVSFRSRGDFADSPLANATVDVAGPAITLGATRALVGGYVVPIDGVQSAHAGTYSEATILWDNGGPSGTDGTPAVYVTDRFSAAYPHALADAVVVGKGTKGGTGADPSGTASAWIEGVRLPYGRSLYT